MIDPNQWIQGQEEVVQRVEKIPTKAAKSNELHKSKSMGSLLHDVSQVGLLKATELQDYFTHTFKTHILRL